MSSELPTTFEELDNLPENGGFDFREEWRDGKKVRRPYIREAFALANTKFVTDSHGVTWLVGQVNGNWYKSKTTFASPYGEY